VKMMGIRLIEICGNTFSETNSSKILDSSAEPLSIKSKYVQNSIGRIR